MSSTIPKSPKQRYVNEASYIYDVGPQYGQRTGQFLFNSLRHEVAEKVRGTMLDPFYKDMELEEIINWLENHIIYDDEGRMICLFDQDTILWEG